jgi:hypothetical protein
MKTTTYLRLALLIPILWWGICLLVFLTVSTSPINEAVSSNTTSVADSLLLLFAFYLFGIIMWILPYALLTLILLSLSFIYQARTTLKIFALSPIAMTVFIIAWVNLLGMAAPGVGMMSSNPVANYQDFISSNLLFAVVTLIWGYICVGTGFGIYKLLQRFRIIPDEGRMESVLQPINQYE